MAVYRTFAARIIDATGRCPSDDGARTLPFFTPQVSRGDGSTVACPDCGRRWSAITLDAEESTHQAGRPPVCDFDTTRR